MKYKIILAPDAVNDLKQLRKYDSAAITDKIREHLSHQPEQVSKTLIKRLSGFDKPQYRLRVGDYRVFYDVIDGGVHILAIISKPLTSEWLEKEGLKS